MEMEEGDGLTCRDVKEFHEMLSATCLTVLLYVVAECLINVKTCKSCALLTWRSATPTLSTLAVGNPDSRRPTSRLQY